jgi:hypothetical protein
VLGLWMARDGVRLTAQHRSVLLDALTTLLSTLVDGHDSPGSSGLGLGREEALAATTAECLRLLHHALGDPSTSAAKATKTSKAATAGVPSSCASLLLCPSLVTVFCEHSPNHRAAHSLAAASSTAALSVTTSAAALS